MEEVIPNFRDQNVQSAVKNLIAYSLVILVVPLGSMFLLKALFFERFMGYEKNDAMMYSAIIAVVLVHVVLIFWIKTANNEGKPKAE
jgi:high-affinity K+ transport system ATPase subunit B